MVKGVGQGFRTNPCVAPAGALTVVSAERDDTSKVVAFGVVGSSGVDGDRACLGHDEFAPRVEGGFEIDHKHWCQIDQFNGPGFGNAMTRVTNLQRDLVNTVAKHHTCGKLVGHEGIGLRGKDAVDGGCPFVRQDVVIKIPRLRGVEFHLSL